MTKDQPVDRRRSASLADLLYAPDRPEREPGLRLCTPSPAAEDARPPIRHLAHSFVKCLDGTCNAACTTYIDGIVDQVTTHIDKHPEDTRATLDILLRALAEAARDSHERASRAA